MHIPGERSGTMLEFALASCMSPGTPFDHGRSDAVLGKLLEDARRPDGPELALFVGDQVYLDDNADLFVTGTPKEYFFKRYRDAFGLPSLSALMRRLPVYMAPDDHEIFDNFNGRSGLPKASQQQVQSCIMAFDAFQGSHGPASILLPGVQQQPGSHWYAFEAHGYPFFVMDTRFERERRANRFVSPEQLDALCAFLKEHKTRAKFVASGSILFPILESTAANPQVCAVSDDSWLGYPEAALQVLRFIKTEGIDNTIFLAGDAHCSLFTRVEIAAADDTTTLHAWSIVSSGVYTPYPFANNKPQDYVLDSHSLPAGSWVSTQLGGVSWRTVQSFDKSCYAIVRVDNQPATQLAVHFEGMHDHASGFDRADATEAPWARRVA